MTDADVIHELYRVSYRRLVSQLFGITGDLSEAQDAVQEAFVQALARPQSFAEIDNPEAWLRTVAVNVTRRRWRRRLRLEALLGRRPVPVEPDLSPDHVALMSALRLLPRGQREAIGLHHLADLPIDEVAEILGVSAGTVKSRLSRGRTQLARLLGPSREEMPHA